MTHVELGLRDVYAARKRISPYVQQTPLVYSRSISHRTGGNVYLKLENQQITRSFKVRGAANRLLRLNEDERQLGVITVSTGNHGKAVATMANSLGIRAVICVPELVLQHKVNAIRDIGAEIVVTGKDQEEAEENALELAEEQGLTYVSPFDDPDILLGQGTIALEILDELPEVDHVVVPLSGGGLLSGIALALKQTDRRIRTTGVSMDRSPVMYWSVQAGRPIQMPELATLADSLMGGIGLGNRYTFSLIRRYMDNAVLVSESEIENAMKHLLIEERLVVEGGGSVGVAALLHDRVSEPGDNIVVVVSGGNADMVVVQRLLSDNAT